MFKFNKYVPASCIWSSAEDFVDNGPRCNTVRGYNIEVRKLSNNETYWMSACWFSGSPEDYYNDEFHQFYFNDLGVEPTGRICFRGYGEEYYDPYEKEEYIKPLGQLQ